MVSIASLYFSPQGAGNYTHTRLNILKSKSTETLEIEVIALNSLNQEECQYFLDKVIEQKVSAFIYHHLQFLSPSSIPPIILNSLKDVARKKTFFNLALMNELNIILKALNTHNIPVIVLKGAYLAKTVYAQVNLREIADIDLLFCKDRVEEASQILQNLGYSFLYAHQTQLEIEQN